ncbi:hypothetical protein [Enterococcus sp. AZ102]|uniref:hypothetical protein n=1 Tax=Enterococcus sp. AZ102 TaxID=2774865 RepID=UPI003F688DB5
MMNNESVILKIKCPNCNKNINITYNTEKCPKCEIDFDINQVHSLFHAYETRLANSKMYKFGQNMERTGDNLNSLGNYIQQIGCFIFSIPLGLFCIWLIWTLIR